MVPKLYLRNGVNAGYALYSFSKTLFPLSNSINIFSVQLYFKVLQLVMEHTGGNDFVLHFKLDQKSNYISMIRH